MLSVILALVLNVLKFNDNLEMADDKNTTENIKRKYFKSENIKKL